jgi:hypothetical protein
MLLQQRQARSWLAPQRQQLLALVARVDEHAGQVRAQRLDVRLHGARARAARPTGAVRRNP